MQASMQRFVLVFFAAGAIPQFAAIGRAQEEPATLVEVQVVGKGKKAATVGTPTLRPNTTTEVGLVLKNAHDEKLTAISVKLVQLMVGKKDRILAESKPGDLMPGEKTLLAFEAVKGKDGPLLGDPPFRIQLHVDGKAVGFVPLKLDLDLSIQAPSQYLDPSADFVPRPGTRRLKFEVTDDIRVPGPHKCPVEIVLGPELVQSKKGNFGIVLDQPKQKEELFADGLTFLGKLPRGRVYLKVDGYDRAFTYDVALAGEGKVNLRPFVTKIGARILIARYMKPDANFVLPLQLDGPLTDEYRVEVALDRSGEKEKFTDIRNLIGVRQKKLALTVGASKNLIVQTEVNDWRPQFNTAGIFGDMNFRIRVFNGVTQETLDLSAEPLPGLAKLESDAMSKTLYVRITQDDTPVEEITFANLSKDKEWDVGKKVPVEIRIKKREANQAPVEKIIFVRGAPPKEKEEIKDIIDFEDAPDEAKSEWLFLVPAQAKPEPMVVSVLFVTKTGIKSAKTETIYYKDAKGATEPAKTLATIKGVLKHGDIRQPNQEVVLSDGKKKETAKTNDKGEFLFKDVPPGNYVVSALIRDVATFTAEKKVVVKDGTKSEDIGDLSLLQKN